MNLSEISPEEMYEHIIQAKLPKEQFYETRDKSRLSYRHYSANSKLVIILLHGIAEDGKYLFRLAEYLSSKQIAQVYTPDLRGYGNSGSHKGDVDYIGQLEDDLEDFVTWIKAKNKNAKIILGGHSFGGASMLRFSASQSANQVHAYLFIAPFIHPSAPTTRKGDSGHSKVSLAKLILLMLLEKARIRSFHHSKVLHVNKPAHIQHGGEALQISFRLAMSRIPGNYQEKINAITKPTFVLIGQKDELIDSDKFDSVFNQNPNIVTKVLPNHNHDGILFSQKTYREIEEWLTKL